MHPGFLFLNSEVFGGWLREGEGRCPRLEAFHQGGQSVDGFRHAGVEVHRGGGDYDVGAVVLRDGLDWLVLAFPQDLTLPGAEPPQDALCEVLFFAMYCVADGALVHAYQLRKLALLMA